MTLQLSKASKIKRVESPSMFSQAGDIALGTVETPLALGTGLAAWPASKLAGGYNLVSSFLSGDTAQQTDEKVRKVEEIVASDLTYMPRSQSGQKSVDVVGHAIESLLNPALKLTNVKEGFYGDLPSIEEVDPRLGWFAGLATELAAFKSAHGITKFTKKGFEKLKDKGSRETWKLAAEADKLQQKKNALDAKEEARARELLQKLKESRTRMVSRPVPEHLRHQRPSIGPAAKVKGVLKLSKAKGVKKAKEPKKAEVVEDVLTDVPKPKTKDITPEDQTGLPKVSEETEPVVPKRPIEDAVAEAKALVPEVQKWLEDPNRNPGEIALAEAELKKIASEFNPQNTAHVEGLIGPIDRALVEINRKKPKKAQKVTETDFDELITLSEQEGWVAPKEKKSPVMQNTSQETQGTSLTVAEATKILKDAAKEAKAEQARKLEIKRGLKAEQERQAMFEDFDSSRVKPVEEYDPDLANYGTREMGQDLVDLFGDDRGSFSTKDLSPERLAAINRISKKLKREGQDVLGYLKALGLDKKGIAEIAQTIKEVDQTARELKKVYQPYKNADGEMVIKRRPGPRGKWKGKRLMYPEVKARSFNAVAKAKELTYGAFGDFAKALENPIRAFERAGKELKEEIYNKWRDANHEATLEKKQVRTETKSLAKGFKNSEIRRVGVYAIAQQLRGKEILDHMGVPEGKIPKELSPREQVAYNALREKFEVLLDRVNDMRASIGKRPIKEIENYFTFMRASSMLEQLGLKASPVLSSREYIQKKYKQFGEMPVSFAKLRKKTGVMSVELDPFYLFDRYAQQAIDHIHISPTVAKVAELRRFFEDPKTGKMWAAKIQKPQLDEFLRKWSNHIAGVEEYVLPPKVRRTTQWLQKNLVMALLSFNVRSGLIQPQALKNTATEIGFYYTAKGISSLFSPRKRTHAMYKSKVLESRAMDVGILEAQRGLRSGKIGAVEDLVASTGMKPLKWLDMETAKATWNGAYQLAREKYKMRDKEAINFADDVVTKTQASGARGDVAPIQRIALGRFVTMLQTFTINEWGFLTKDVLGKGDRKLTRAARLAKIWRYVFATTLFNILYEDVLGIKSPSPTPIKAIQKGLENDDNFVSVAHDTMGELFEPIPLLGNTRYGKSVFGGGVEVVADISKILGGDISPISTKGADTILKARGTPGAGQIMKSYRRAKRGGKVQGLLPQALPEEAGELYSVLMGQYTEKKKKRSSKSKRLKF